MTYTVEDGEISVIGQGSGIVMSEDGYIITNSHVVGNSRDYKVRVVTYEEEEYDAVVIGYDTKTDLAAIKVEATNLSPAEFGDSDALEVGDTVVAIGNPAGLPLPVPLPRGLFPHWDGGGKCIPALLSSFRWMLPSIPAIPAAQLVNEYGKVIGINSGETGVHQLRMNGFFHPHQQGRKMVLTTC